MVKLVSSIGAVALTALVAMSSFARPDLVVSQVRIEPEAPEASSVVAVAATIENIGTESLRVPCDVRFQDNAEEISRSVIEAGFRVGETREVFAAWIASPGDHTLSVSVDEPGNVVREEDESNNANALSLTVEEDAAPRVAVVEFDDRSRARLDNLGVGVSDKLAARLSEGGVRIASRGEMETWMRAAGLALTSQEHLALAARELGVDFVVFGTVDAVDVDAQSLDLGLVRLSGAQAHVSLTAHVVRADASKASVRSASGSGAGPTSLSVSLGLFAAPLCDVCAGGLVADRTTYGEGELVSFGYRGDAAPGWFGLELYAADGAFLRWLGWRFVERDGCETWVWNQRDGPGMPVVPGTYTARLRDDGALLGMATLQIRPSLTWTVPSLEQLTVGTAAFDQDAVGVAINDAVGQLADAILPVVLAPKLSRAAPSAEESEDALPAPPLGQIASILPGGGVTINIGTANGVTTGDRFEVVAVDRLVYDPVSMTIVSYEVIESRGEMEIVEARERASTGICLGLCNPSVGDLVRRIP